MVEGTEQSAQNAFGIGILRPELRHEQISFRGHSLSAEQRKSVAKALRSLHTLEMMAVNIYRYQITRRESELNRELIAAMCNEMTHTQDFQVKLHEYRMPGSLLGWAYQAVGFVLGFGSRLLGTRTILKTGIWAENKAIAHYARLLTEAPWDAVTRGIIEKNRSDENGHLQTWLCLLHSGADTYSN